MSKRRVLIEWRGHSRPALIWAGRRAWEQWLGPETTDLMGVHNLVMFWAEQIGPVWHIGDLCEADYRVKAELLDVARTSGRILPPRTPSHERALIKAVAQRMSQPTKKSKGPPRTRTGKLLLTPKGTAP
jgi:hypothetical protein